MSAWPTSSRSSQNGKVSSWGRGTELDPRSKLVTWPLTLRVAAALRVCHPWFVNNGGVFKQKQIDHSATVPAWPSIEPRGCVKDMALWSYTESYVLGLFLVWSPPATLQQSVFVVFSVFYISFADGMVHAWVGQNVLICNVFET